jgi:hypothetical protein
MGRRGEAQKLEHDVTDGARAGPIPERQSQRKPIRAQSKGESGDSYTTDLRSRRQYPPEAQRGQTH